jgi:hypothetical protein
MVKAVIELCAMMLLLWLFCSMSLCISRKPIGALIMLKSGKPETRDYVFV